MKNLQKFESARLGKNDILKIKGNDWKDRILDIIVFEVWEWSKENLFSYEAQARYGRRMVETGSPGGHK